MCFSTLPKAFGLGRLASAPLSKVSPLTIIKEKKYPASFPGVSDALTFFCLLFLCQDKKRSKERKENQRKSTP